MRAGILCFVRLCIPSIYITLSTELAFNKYLKYEWMKKTNEWPDGLMNNRWMNNASLHYYGPLIKLRMGFFALSTVITLLTILWECDERGFKMGQIYIWSYRQRGLIILSMEKMQEIPIFSRQTIPRPCFLLTLI